MNDESRYLDHASLPWRETSYPGVRWKKLHFDPASGRSSVLLSFAPGASYGNHRHPAGEQYLVLEGTLEDGGLSWGPGTFVHHPPGSEHRPSSPDGCLLFVTLDQPVQELEPS